MIRNLLLLCFSIMPMIASAADVTDLSDAKTLLWWAVNALFALVLVIIGFVWRSHVEDYGTHKKDTGSKFDAFKRDLEDRMRKDDFTRMQSSIHDSINGLKAEMTRFRLEDSAAVARTVAEIWEDVKEHREDSRELNKEIWTQIEDTRDKMNNQQVALARSYHTKDEIADMLDDKLGPLFSMLRNIQNPAYGGPRRRDSEGG